MSLLQSVDDIEIVMKVDHRDQLSDHLKNMVVHILIINIHHFNAQFVNLIMADFQLRIPCQNVNNFS